MSQGRAKQLADRIQQIVAEMLERRIKDPRLGFVTITEARLTGDLREATVFYTVFGSDEDREGSTAALESAKGLIRSEVGKQLGLRHTPSLTFIADAIPENAAHIEDLLRRAHESDAEVARRALGADYAAGADPYRETEDELDGAGVAGAGLDGATRHDAEPADSADHIDEDGPDSTGGPSGFADGRPS